MIVSKWIIALSPGVISIERAVRLEISSPVIKTSTGKRAVSRRLFCNSGADLVCVCMCVTCIYSSLSIYIYIFVQLLRLTTYKSIRCQMDHCDVASYMKKKKEKYHKVIPVHGTFFGCYVINLTVVSALIWYQSRDAQNGAHTHVCWDTFRISKGICFVSLRDRAKRA